MSSGRGTPDYLLNYPYLTLPSYSVHDNYCTVACAGDAFLTMPILTTFIFDLLYRLALIFYEYFLTLDDEVMFFWNWKKTPMQSWKRWLRPSLQKFMYFLNRYGNLLYTIHIVLYKTQSLGGKVSE